MSFGSSLTMKVVGSNPLPEACISAVLSYGFVQGTLHECEHKMSEASGIDISGIDFVTTSVSCVPVL